MEKAQDRQRQQQDRERNKKPSTIWKTGGVRQTWSENVQARMTRMIRQEQSKSLGFYATLPNDMSILQAMESH